MHPELFTIPGIQLSLKTYGFFLMVGFLSAVWLAMRRARRSGIDPDRFLDLSFLALFFGVGGARLFYVVHYWKTDFAPRDNVWLAVIDIREGGLEFLGGLLGAMVAMIVYLRWNRLSIRPYLDVAAPGAMWGLAFGRLGCFFNGCCFGAACLAPGGQEARFPWAVQFPYGSPAHVRQWEERRVSVPAELIVTRGAQAYLLPAATLNAPLERLRGPDRKLTDAEEALKRAKASGADDALLVSLNTAVETARKQRESARKTLAMEDLEYAQRFPSRINPERGCSISELTDLASSCRSLPVHPTQLYASISALLVCGVLSMLYYQRRRIGSVFGWMLVLYPVNRVFEELIRVDNPHDVAGLTASQFVSLAMFAAGIVYLFAINRIDESSAAHPAPAVT